MSETATPTVGVPDGINKERVLARKTALILHGTHPLHAEKLAIDAEQQQVLIDALKAEEAKAEKKASDKKSEGKKEKEGK